MREELRDGKSLTTGATHSLRHDHLRRRLVGCRSFILDGILRSPSTRAPRGQAAQSWGQTGAGWRGGAAERDLGC